MSSLSGRRLARCACRQTFPGCQQVIADLYSFSESGSSWLPLLCAERRVSPHFGIRLASWQPYRQCAALHLCSPHINEMPAISTGRLPSLPWSGRLGCLPRSRTRGGAAVGVLPAGAAHAGKGRGAADRPGRALLLRSGGALVVLAPAMTATHALRPLPFCCPLPCPSANRLWRSAASTHVLLLNPTTRFPSTCRAALCSHHIGSGQRHCGAHVWRGRNRQAAQDGDRTPSCVHLSVQRQGAELQRPVQMPRGQLPAPLAAASGKVQSCGLLCMCPLGRRL